MRAPLDLLGTARRELDLPLVAIGGITPDNARELLAAGADALAVISALFAAPDIGAAARRFTALFESSSMKTSQKLFQRAQLVTPGGVNSPVRAFRAVGGTPLFFQRGKGALVWDADGASYVDYVGSWGPLIVGHAHPEVVKAVERAAADGLSFGAPTEAEVEMAELLCKLVPSLEQVRLVSSGTEATMSAIRLARGFTGRSKIVKFEGCYHGHADALLVKAGSGALTFGQPSSAGVPAETAMHTVVLEYNNVSALEQAFATEGRRDRRGDRRAGRGQHEPRRAAAGFSRSAAHAVHAPRRAAHFRRSDDGFSRRARRRAGALRHPARSHDARQGDRRRHAGGRVRRAPRRHAVGSRRSGPVYQAGTLSGNPVALAAGLATLKLIQAPGFYDALAAEATRSLCEKLAGCSACAKNRIFRSQRRRHVRLYFRERPPQSHRK